MSELPGLCREALARPGGTGVIEFEHRWYGWDDLRRVAARLGELVAQSGVAADAPVTFIPRNRPWAIAALLALLGEGRTLRMVYAFQSPAGIIRDIQRLAAPLVIAEPGEFAPEVTAAMAAAGYAGITVEGLEAAPLAGAEKARADAEYTPAISGRVEILTSGTTGPPKQFPVEFAMIEKLLAGGTGASQMAAADQPPGLLYMPIGNISGIYSTIPTMLRGSRAVLLDRFRVDDWRDYLARHQPKVTGLPPAGVQMVLDADVPVEELAGLMAIGTGAAPLDPTVQAAFEERYGIPILISYGATEFGGPVTSMTLQDIENSAPPSAAA